MAAAGSGPAGCSYLPLCNVQAGKGYCNVWGYVLECTTPYKTNGTDYACKLYLTDPSTVPHREGISMYDMLENRLEVIFFSNRPETLPMLREVGDFIRFHSVKQQGYKEKKQLIAKIGVGGATEYCLFDGALEGADSPYQRSSHKKPVTADDKVSLNLLRKIFHNLRQPPQPRLPSHPAPADLRVQIWEMRAGTSVDSICKVVAVDRPGTLKQTVYVWDGTDSLPHDPSLNWREMVRNPEGNISLDGSSTAANIHRRQSYLKGKGAVQDFPTLGSVVPVTLYHPMSSSDRAKRFKAQHGKAGEDPLPEPPAVGSWIKLHDINIISVEGQVQALVHPGSSWSPREEDRLSIEQYEKRIQGHSAREIASWAPREEKELLAKCISSQGSSLPYTSLRQILMEAGTGEVKVYRCLVRVILHLPKLAAEFCRKSGEGRPMEFCIKLCLQDATAELDAMLLGENGSSFFNGCPQQDLRKNETLAAVLENLMGTLRGAGCTRQGGAWLECSLRRLYPDRKAPRRASTAKYKIEDTALAGHVAASLIQHLSCLTAGV